MALAFDSRIHQLVNRLGKKRFRDAQIAPRKIYDFSDPPWSIPLNDSRYSLQLSNGGVIDFFKKKKDSPEWMVAVTARQIAIHPEQFRFQFIEYKLTGSNEKNALVPEGISELEYLWWRLEHYFGINSNNAALFTDELLTFALNLAKLMWDSTDPFFDDTHIISNLIISYKAHQEDGVEESEFVAWSPKGYNAPIELIAVKIKQGKITQREWWEALSDRVNELAVQAGEQATLQACRDLGLPETDDPSEAGQYLVLGNLNLRTHLDLAVIDKPPFPARVGERNPEAQQAIDETDLASWVEHAWSLVSPSSLD